MHIDGPKQDPLSPTDTLAYSIALTVLKKYRGLGLGRKLKAAQLTALRGKLSRWHPSIPIFGGSQSRWGH